MSIIDSIARPLVTGTKKKRIRRPYKKMKRIIKKRYSKIKKREKISRYRNKNRGLQ